MKITQLLTALVAAAALVSVSYAGSGKDGSIRYGQKGPVADKLAEAVALAKDKSASVERVAQAVAEAIQQGQSPSEVLTRVLDARPSWTDEQVSFLYKTVVTATPGLSASMAQNISAYEAAGKPSAVSPDAPEGVKVLAALSHGTTHLDSVISSVVAGSTGAVEVVPVAPLRDVQPAEPHPVVPTPPVVSSSN